MAAASSSSSSWTYDMFLSFRGEDTRHGFTSLLYTALRQSGIHAFMDDSGIERGEDISFSLLLAIQRSRMGIIIFSPDYASSRWCLDELLQIMECHRTKAQMVIPIFYKVNPSDVRDPRDSYSKAMEQHLVRMTTSGNKYRMWQWRHALRAAANIAGFNSTILSYVTQILDGCGLHAKSGLQVLIERSLLKVGRNNKLEMHDLLQEMGKEIILESSPKIPEERTWFHEEVLDVLKEHTGTKAIEGLSLKVPGTHKECLIDSKAFKEMRKLRLLELDYVNLKGDYAILSKRLRWLCWHGFPLKCTPNTFYQEKLVAIDFKYSNLQVVWKEPQLLEMLKTLNLSHSSYLTQTLDFTKLPNLERLVMKNCLRLILIDESIGDLKTLLHVNLKDCKSLRELPRSIYKLKSLKTLILFGCLLIDHLEEDFEQMESLTSLMADNTAITQVPFSLARLGGLVQHGYVSLCGYEGKAQDIFPSLTSSWMSRSNIPQSSIEEFVQSISSLVLSVQQNSGFHGLSPFQLARPAGPFNSLLLQLGGCDKADFLKDRISQGWNYGGWDDSHLPGNRYPDWFIYKGEGCSINFKVPQVIGCQLKAMLLNVVYYSCMDNTTTHQFLLNVLIINYTKATIMQHGGDWVTFHENAKCQSIIPSVQPGDLMELVLSIGPQFLVKKIAAYLIFDGSKRRRLLT